MIRACLHALWPLVSLCGLGKGNIQQFHEMKGRGQYIPTKAKPQRHLEHLIAICAHCPQEGGGPLAHAQFYVWT